MPVSISKLMEDMSNAGAPLEAVLIAVRAIEAMDTEMREWRSRRSGQKAKERAGDKLATVASITGDNTATVANMSPDPSLPFPEKEKSPPTTPSKEKQTQSLSPRAEVGAASDETGKNVVKLARQPKNIEKSEALLLIGEWWNGLASQCGLGQIDAIIPGSERESHAWCRARELAKDYGSLSEGLRILDAKIRGSPFLLGQKADFRAKFNWVVNVTNFQKIMEGDYDENCQAKRQ